MKILFLDIDGVCNGHQWLWDHQEDISNDTSPGYAEIEPACIARIAQVLWETGAVVCVSSSWRHRFSLEGLKRFFSVYGIEVVGLTPTIEPGPRGHEISAWLQTTDLPVTTYAVVDDGEDAGIGHEDVFVRTDWKTGIQDKDVRDLVWVLGVNPLT